LDCFGSWLKTQSAIGESDMALSDQPEQIEPANGGVGPGSAPVGLIGIILISLYLVIATVVALYGLVVLWPGGPPLKQTQPPVESTAAQTSSAEVSPVPGAGTTPTQRNVSGLSAQRPAESTPSPTPESKPSEITIFGERFMIWDEVRLLLIVILAGALGSLVHALRSVYWYVGNRALRWSWLGKYLLLPFGGSALAVIFYVVVRGGFFSPQANIQQTSPFGFAALAAMVGLFSEQAVLKLKEVAETVFVKPQSGADSKPQDN
jgi:hypothetical protein